MNMLIGILCEVVSAVAAAEKESAAITMMKSTLLVMLKELDDDGSGSISREELLQVMENPCALEILANLQVDVKYLMELQEMLYEERGKSHSISNIMFLILGC